jgi:hypothetical protein
MPEAHRDTDSRICGAKTVVSGQSTVTVNGLLWAVEGDEDSHGGGNLIATGSTVTIEGKLVIVNSPDPAAADLLCPIDPIHCNPKTSEGSGNVSAY